MSTQLTVFGNIIREGETADFSFQKNGKLTNDPAQAIIQLRFSIDEDREPCCLVMKGLDLVDFALPGYPKTPLGGLLGATYPMLEGIVEITKRFECADYGDHYVFTMRTNGATYEEREQWDEYSKAGRIGRYADADGLN